MAEPDRVQTVRDNYTAYQTRDRELLERSLSESFRFYSPDDPGIDRARYFERCWPNAGHIKAFELTRLIAWGDQVVVTYEATRTDGSRFCNTEIHTFDDDRIGKVEVYYGWNLDADLAQSENDH